MTKDMPIIDGYVHVPFHLITPKMAREMEQRLSFRLKSYQKGTPDKVMSTLVVDDERGMARVPFNYGLGLLQRLAKGGQQVLEFSQPGLPLGKVPRLPDPHHPKAAPNQAQFFADLVAAVESQRTVLACAPTGSGKTPTALYAIAKFGRKALIICPSKEMAEQWRREITLHLGLPPTVLGKWEDGVFESKGKKIVVAVIHNIFQMDVPAEDLAEFGIVVWDEAHRVAAEHFHSTFGKFSAKCRVGLTATPNRRDGLTNVITDAFGPPTVIAEGEALPVQVRVVDYRPSFKVWGDPQLGWLVSRLTKDELRNTLVVKAIKGMFNDNRNILVLSDRIEHLEHLRELCISAGIPEGKTGLYTRQYTAENGKRKTKGKEALAEVRENAQVIFSTYGMGKEGIDIPRLDGGIDATPRADGTQAVGRIRRPFPGKRTPVWITIRDLGIPLLVGMSRSRVRDYTTSGANVREYSA